MDTSGVYPGMYPPKEVATLWHVHVIDNPDLAAVLDCVHLKTDPGPHIECDECGDYASGNPNSSCACGAVGT